MKKVMLLVVMLVAVAGCVSQVDPETGQELTQLDPKVVDKVDDVAEMAEMIAPIATVAGMLWPPLLAIVPAVVTGIGIWRKLKPQVTTAKAEAQQYHAITMAVVHAIELWKIERPTDWEYLRDKLKELIGPKAEAVIAALKTQNMTG